MVKLGYFVREGRVGRFSFFGLVLAGESSKLTSTDLHGKLKNMFSRGQISGVDSPASAKKDFESVMALVNGADEGEYQVHPKAWERIVAERPWTVNEISEFLKQVKVENQTEALKGITDVKNASESNSLLITGSEKNLHGTGTNQTVSWSVQAGDIKVEVNDDVMVVGENPTVPAQQLAKVMAAVVPVLIKENSALLTRLGDMEKKSTKALESENDAVNKMLAANNQNQTLSEELGSVKKEVDQLRSENKSLNDKGFGEEKILSTIESQLSALKLNQERIVGILGSNQDKRRKQNVFKHVLARVLSGSDSRTSFILPSDIMKVFQNSGLFGGDIDTLSTAAVAEFIEAAVEEGEDVIDSLIACINKHSESSNGENQIGVFWFPGGRVKLPKSNPTRLNIKKTQFIGDLKELIDQAKDKFSMVIIILGPVLLSEVKTYTLWREEVSELSNDKVRIVDLLSSQKELGTNIAHQEDENNVMEDETYSDMFVSNDLLTTEFAVRRGISLAVGEICPSANLTLCQTCGSVCRTKCLLPVKESEKTEDETKADKDVNVVATVQNGTGCSKFDRNVQFFKLP